MIDLEELKPILQGVLTDENTTPTIEAIMKIDKPIENQADRIKELEDENLRIKSEYDTKLKEMFFGGTSRQEEVVEKPDETVEEVEKTSYEELFKEEE